MVYGYRKRQYHDYCIGRDIRYGMYCQSTNSPVEIWDWEPHELDPSKEEIMKIKEEHNKKASEEYLITRAYYKSQGIDVM